MAVTAVKPQVKAPAKPASAKPPPPAVMPPAAPPRHRGKITPLTPMRVQAAKSMSRLAGKVKESHPELPAGQHLMDAARTLRQGNHEASQRHLRAAMFSLTPQSLMRNGMHTDDLHTGAREVMHGVHRHLLLVKDLDDVQAKNRAALQRDSYGDDASSPPMPQPPAHDAGFGPGALAQKPTARQPGADRAMNAPASSGSGGSDPAVADPVGPQPKGSRQFTRNEGRAAAYTWNDLADVIELVGPGGWSHGWVRGTALDMMSAANKADPSNAAAFRDIAGVARGITSDTHQQMIDKVTPATAVATVRRLIAAGVDPKTAAGAVSAKLKGQGNALKTIRAMQAKGQYALTGNEVRRPIDLNWGKWDAGERAGASAKAHDTASATASRDHLHKIAADADAKFPSAKAGGDLHAAAEAFAKGDKAEVARRITAARVKLRNADEIKGKSPTSRYNPGDKAANDQLAMDGDLKTEAGNAAQLSQIPRRAVDLSRPKA